jgi:thioredoxin reductase
VSTARPEPEDVRLDVAIVGGGPAGLSAALVLGRCRRRVVLYDVGRARNAASPALHGFLSRDGIPPQELLAIAHAQLAPYESVSIERVEVLDAEAASSGFRLRLAGDRTVLARKLLLATGVVDVLPDLGGLAALYGRSVFHCPYCDGWEQRDLPLGAYGRGDSGYGLAFELLGWSRDVILFSDGPADLEAAQRTSLDRHGILLVERRVAALAHRHGALDAVVLDNGERIRRRALFLGAENVQASALALRLGCGLTPRGAVATGKSESTCVPGLFVAGDASGGEQLVVVAASEGVKAAIAIHRELAMEDRPRALRTAR